MAEMNGLLDWVQTPEGQGLLSAAFGGLAAAGHGGPLNTLGASGLAGLVGYSKGIDSQLDRQKKQAILDWSQAGGKVTGSPFTAGQQALAVGAQNGSVGPTVQNAAMIPGLQDKQQTDYLAYLEKGARLGAPNIEPLFNIHKFKVQGYERSTDKDQYDGNGNLISRGVKLPDGMINNNGVPEWLGGDKYPQMVAGLEGMKAGATERQKARFTIVPPQNAPYINGRPGVFTQEQLSDMLMNGAGGNAQQPPIGQPQPAGNYQIPDTILDGLKRTESGGNNYALNKSTKAMGPYQFMPETVISLHKAGYKFDPFDEGQARQAASYLLTQNLQKTGGNMDKALAMYGGFVTKDPTGYISKVKGRSSIPQGPYYPTPSEQAQDLAQVEVGKHAVTKQIDVQADVGKDAALKQQDQERKSTQMYSQMKTGIAEARDLLKDATGSGIGSLADKTVGFFGVPTKGAIASQKLDVIGGWMTANVPRMEGPQSDRDVLMYRQMAAQVADKSLPVETRMGALDSLDMLMDRYADINGGANKAKQPSATPSGMPQAGDVIKGHRFKGGNPADRNNWEKL